MNPPLRTAAAPLLGAVASIVSSMSAISAVVRIFGITWRRAPQIWDWSAAMVVVDDGCFGSKGPSLAVENGGVQ